MRAVREGEQFKREALMSATGGSTFRSQAKGVLEISVNLVAVKTLGNMITLVFVFGVLGRFWTKVGPRSPSNKSSSKNGAERI
jgi:hypothetical protein